MKRCEEIQGLIIDEYYRETCSDEINQHIKSCQECAEFSRKLNAVSENMDFSIEDMEVPADLFNIIETADGITKARKNRIEIFEFSGIALAILSIAVLIGITAGFKVILGIQIFFYINLPLILIPVLKNRRIKEDVR